MLHDISSMGEIEAHAYVISLMLFPEHDKKTLRAYYYFCIKNASIQISTDIYNHDQSTLNHAKLGRFIGRIMNEKGGYTDFESALFSNNGAIEAEIRARSFIGAFVGRLLHYMIEKKDNISISIDEFSKTMKRYTDGGGTLLCSMSYTNFRNNIWPLFKKVGHLWAASSIVAELNKTHGSRHDENAVESVLCQHLSQMGLPNGLPGFLVLAESCLNEGRTVDIKRRGPIGPLLDLQDSHEFKLPWGLKFKPTILK
jgi:hypothetical protein